MANNFYGALALTGGATGALDAIDGSGLSDKNGAFVITSTTFYPYYLDAGSGAAENSPTVISPDANAGTKRWLLKSGIFDDLTAYGNVSVTGSLVTTGNVSVGTTYTNAPLSVVPSTGIRVLFYDGGTIAQGGDGYFAGFGIDFPSAAVTSFVVSNTNSLAFGRFTNNDDIANFTEWARFNNDGNFGIGGTTFDATARKILQITGSTEPAAGVVDTVQIYEKDSSQGGGHGTLGLYLEEAVEAGAPTMSHKIRVWINGTEYWLGLDAV